LALMPAYGTQTTAKSRFPTDHVADQHNLFRFPADFVVPDNRRA